MTTEVRLAVGQPGRRSCRGKIGVSAASASPAAALSTTLRGRRRSGLSLRGLSSAERDIKR
jgi:hypothetical protein